ncbi:MAG: aldose 1-epimerase family protein [Roseivirga sp.]
MTFLLDQGAAITQLRFASKPEAEILKPQPGYHYESSLLFPFPNRLADGKYSFQGKQYQFEHNDFGLPNALHGSVSQKLFTLMDQGKDDTKAWATAQFNDSGNDVSYPFAYTLEVTYALSQNSLSIEFKVINQGTGQMPFGLGWHPYFNLGQHISNCALKLPGCYEIEVDENLIPTGKKSPSTCFDGYRPLDRLSLDTCFEIREVEQENSTFVKLNDKQALEIWQDAHHAFIQVFTPDDGQTIAIEPMTCGINALNTGEGLQVLAPGDAKTMHCGVRMV